MKEIVWHFRSFVKKKTWKIAASPNMDEVPFAFDIPMGRSVAMKGDKSVTIKTTGHEKAHFTVVLACCADWKKPPPMIFFERRTMLKDDFPPGVVIDTNVRGWMDEEMMGRWLEKCFSRRPGSFFNVAKGLLVMHVQVHITERTLKRTRAKNCTAAVIPGGMTKILQPLDMAVNRSSKAVLRHLWEAWTTEGELSYAATGRMRRT